MTIRNEFDAPEFLIEAFEKASAGDSLIRRLSSVFGSSGASRKEHEKTISDIVLDLTQSLGHFLEIEQPDRTTYRIGEVETKILLQAAERRLSRFSDAANMAMLVFEAIQQQAVAWPFHVDKWQWAFQNNGLVLKK